MPTPPGVWIASGGVFFSWIFARTKSCRKRKKVCDFLLTNGRKCGIIIPAFGAGGVA